jgi:hypothetical protein
MRPILRQLWLSSVTLARSHYPPDCRTLLQHPESPAFVRPRMGDLQRGFSDTATGRPRGQGTGAVRHASPTPTASATSGLIERP